MTQRQVERIVRGWQERLRLQNWKIEIRWDDPGDEAHARIKVADDYEHAIVTFSPAHKSWTRQFANDTVVHELLHIFENGAGVAMESLDGILTKPAFALLEKRYNHEIEGWIERLALIIVDLAGVI